ncbi:hypothetical protein [Croceicoccus marinus]|uniref:Lipoprotein n=1 Tax=Croceicoccus marinus TaxID=450378 RepID=A0A1Z1FAB8_9SPHN|nr:hypothetical protein [Croceicoccus marinus]ARU15676.1 hypothetical protein A9D14_05135 [Croceicoccus marinus]
MRRLIPAILLAAMALGGCASDRGSAASPHATRAAPQGSAVAIGQPVMAGDLMLTPLAVKEDSRCALGTQCIWAGRIVVSTRVTGTGWSETADLVAGEDMIVGGRTMLLESALPERVAEREIAAGDYRFMFLAR